MSSLKERFFTQEELTKLLGIKQKNISVGLSDVLFKLKKIEGSTKRVKHYRLEDLPEKYIAKLKDQGIEPVKKEPNKSKSKFTSVYLRAKPENQRKAVLKNRLVRLYLGRNKQLSTKKWLEKVLYENMDFDLLGEVSDGRLYAWKSTYEKALKEGLNLIECFIDIRGNKKNTTFLSKTQQEMAERFFLKKSHPSVSNIHFIMKEHFGASMPSYDVLNNFYKRWKKANPQLHLFSKSPDKWKNSYLVAIGSESEKARYRNHFWEFDATPADVICADGKRYTIMGLIDIATRRPIFTVEESNSAFAVSRLLRKGILNLGIPENIVVDNGKEFVSNHFESVCSNLEIQVHVTPPFSGDKKPFIERVFGTLARGLFRELHGFIGHHVGMREEIQARMSFGHKIMAQRKFKEDLRTKEEEDAYAKLWSISKENIGIELEFALTKDELQDAINTWVDKLYNQREHGGIHKKPIDAWNSYKQPVESISDKSMLDLLLGKSIKRKVNKKGISLDGCEYWHDELLNWMGKSVKVMTHDDLGEIIVYDMESMKLICKANDAEHRGESREAATVAKVKQKKIIRTMAKTVKEAVEMDDPTLMGVLAAKTEEIKSQTTAVTKHTAVTDMLLDESSKLEQMDRDDLEKSNHFDFKNKDEDGLPQKILEGGRPEFETFTDRFVWCLEHEEWSEKDLALKEKRPEAYEMALVEYERRKVG